MANDQRVTRGIFSSQMNWLDDMGIEVSLRFRAIPASSLPTFLVTTEASSLGSQCVKLHIDILLFTCVQGKMALPPTVGAVTQLFAATAPEAASLSGKVSIEQPLLHNSKHFPVVSRATCAAWHTICLRTG